MRLVHQSTAPADPALPTIITASANPSSFVLLNMATSSAAPSSPLVGFALRKAGLPTNVMRMTRVLVA